MSRGGTTSSSFEAAGFAGTIPISDSPGPAPAPVRSSPRLRSKRSFEGAGRRLEPEPRQEIDRQRNAAAYVPSRRRLAPSPGFAPSGALSFRWNRV